MIDKSIESASYILRQMCTVLNKFASNLKSSHHISKTLVTCNGTDWPGPRALEIAGLARSHDLIELQL